MQGLQPIKCILLGHTSRFHPFIMAAEICCAHRNTLFVSIHDEHFSFYLIIQATLIRKCFYMQTQLQGIEFILTVVWTVNHQNKFITRLQLYIILFFRHQPQSNEMTVNLMYRQLVMKMFVQENQILESFLQNGKF